MKRILLTIPKNEDIEVYAVELGDEIMVCDYDEFLQIVPKSDKPFSIKDKFFGVEITKIAEIVHNPFHKYPKKETELQETTERIKEKNEKL